MSCTTSATGSTRCHRSCGRPSWPASRSPRCATPWTTSAHAPGVVELAGRLGAQHHDDHDAVELHDGRHLDERPHHRTHHHHHPRVRAGPRPGRADPGPTRERARQEPAQRAGDPGAVREPARRDPGVERPRARAVHPDELDDVPVAVASTRSGDSPRTSSATPPSTTAPAGSSRSTTSTSSRTPSQHGRSARSCRPWSRPTTSRSRSTSRSSRSPRGRSKAVTAPSSPSTRATARCSRCTRTRRTTRARSADELPGATRRVGRGHEARRERLPAASQRRDPGDLPAGLHVQDRDDRGDLPLLPGARDRRVPGRPTSTSSPTVRTSRCTTPAAARAAGRSK